MMRQKSHSCLASPRQVVDNDFFLSTLGGAGEAGKREQLERWYLDSFVQHNLYVKVHAVLTRSTRCERSPPST